MENERHIYGLFDPATNEIKYIGQTRDLKTRYSYHRSASSFDQSAKGKWLLSLRLQDLAPEIEVLEVVPADRANETERFWIEYFRMLGSTLTNRRHFQACNYSPKVNIPLKWRNRKAAA